MVHFCDSSTLEVRQEDCCEFEASLDYKVRFRLAFGYIVRCLILFFLNLLP